LNEKRIHVHTYTTRTHKRRNNIPHYTYETREEEQQEGGGMEWKTERKKEDDTKSKLLLQLV